MTHNLATFNISIYVHQSTFRGHAQMWDSYVWFFTPLTLVSFISATLCHKPAKSIEKSLQKWTQNGRLKRWCQTGATIWCIHLQKSVFSSQCTWMQIFRLNLLIDWLRLRDRYVLHYSKVCSAQILPHGFVQINGKLWFKEKCVVAVSKCISKCLLCWGYGETCVNRTLAWPLASGQTAPLATIKS